MQSNVPSLLRKRVADRKRGFESRRGHHRSWSEPPLENATKCALAPDLDALLVDVRRGEHESLGQQRSEDLSGYRHLALDTLASLPRTLERRRERLQLAEQLVALPSAVDRERLRQLLESTSIVAPHQPQTAKPGSRYLDSSPLLGRPLSLPLGSTEVIHSLGSRAPALKSPQETV